jgi:hypothetical protein
MTSQLRDLKRAISIAVFASFVAGAAGGCGDSPTTPTPTPTPTPAPVVLAVFADTAPGSTFSTTDVRDVQNQIVRIDRTSSSLIWVADGRMFAGFPVSGSYFLRADQAFQVRFGLEAGERRAYFTETVRGTICDINVVNGVLQILPTDTPVPGGG